MSAAERDKFIQKQEFPIFDGTQEYCLWLGCMGGYDPKGREIVADFARVMNYLGTSYGVLRKEKCTGDPVRRLGNDLALPATRRSESRSPRAKQSQEDRLHLPALRPHHSGRLEGVRHAARDRAPQRIPRAVRRSNCPICTQMAMPPARCSTEEKIVFHDPCYLGRYRNVYDEPRAVVALAGELVEAPRYA